MANIGYSLLCEQSPPQRLVAQAARAEAADFDFATISDHYNPWLHSQGHSPYAWSVLGAVAQVTERIELMSYVTCPIRRYHPAVVAQKAATVGLLCGDRFTLGLGAGENLNEHVVGEWPHVEVRHDMLAEALEIIRSLLAGERLSFHGDYFTVPEARLWDLPGDGVPMAVAISGPESAELAARYGDGMIGTVPDGRLVRGYQDAGGDGRRIGQVAICYGPDEAQCRRTAYELHRWGGFGWHVLAELPEPSAFEQATEAVTEGEVAQRISCGPDVERHVEAVRQFVAAGFTDVAILQIGDDSQDAFLDWASKELLPELRKL
ncbi:MAG: TIGR03557 family F420-dependent LLM class oxidoreductase [Micromonosporaceae bacterium]|nr:TIGR03557 family F420-dependent LLM class oxidoreductase [Micromonosporaceae bacterium]